MHSRRLCEKLHSLHRHCYCSLLFLLTFVQQLSIHETVAIREEPKESVLKLRPFLLRLPHCQLLDLEWFGCWEVPICRCWDSGLIDKCRNWIDSDTPEGVLLISRMSKNKSTLRISRMSQRGSWLLWFASKKFREVFEFDSMTNSFHSIVDKIPICCETGYQL